MWQPCSDAPQEKYQTVTLNGKVRMIAGPMASGKLHFRLYNLWYLDGELRHPLEEIEDFESDTAEFTHTFEYPLHKGTGLAVHAWLDTDGGGIFLPPRNAGKRRQPAPLQRGCSHSGRKL